MIITKNSNISEEEIMECLQKHSVGVELLFHSHLEYTIPDPATNFSSSYATIEVTKHAESKKYCFCKENKGKELTDYCHFCGNGLYRDFKGIVNPVYVDEYNEQLRNYKKDVEDFNDKNDTSYRTHWMSTLNSKENKIKLYDRYYVSRHPDYEYGIIIKKINIVAQNKNNELVLTGKCERFIEIIPGVRCKAYAKKVKMDEEIDLFKAFNLSTNTAKYDIDIDWDGANNMLDFLEINNEFAKRTGFKEIFNNDVGELYKNSFFMIYMYVYSEYPVIELLAKMGYINVINGALKKICSSYNRDDMRKHAEELNKVFNPYGTTGKLSLSIPKYIGDHLNKMNLSYSVFENWGDICAYEKLSKENFEKFITSTEYSHIYKFLGRFANLLKYGYTVSKLSSYIIKQEKLLSCSTSDVIRYIEDYQNIMELLDVEPDMYPSNIKTVHDKAMDSYRVAKNALTDKKLLELSMRAEPLIPENDDFVIIIPKNTTDFVREGERQHNCVASYVRKVFNEECFVFFIRKKDKASESYITAEYRKGGLYQIKAKNNYTVTNNDAIKYAKEFCSKLSKDVKFRSI